MSADNSTEASMSDDSEGIRIGRWLLMDASRPLLAGALTVAVFVAFVVVVEWVSPSFPQQIADTDMMDTTFSAMITAIVTGTTLVVTIGQLVLTQENGPLGDQAERMDKSMDVRDHVASLIGSPSPIEPSTFLSEILDGTEERSRAVVAAVDGTDGDGLWGAVRELDANVSRNADAVRGRLDDAEFGSFDVVAAALQFDYSRKIVAVEHILDDHADSLSEEQRERLDELKTALSLFGPAREHVKTLYFQWALIELSQLILYAAVPALLVAGLMIAVVDVGTFPSQTAGVDNLLLVVASAYAITLVPFMLFVAYVLRILTVAKLTLAIEPLTLQ